MAAAGWAPGVDNYLGRVPKARILEAVREAKGEPSAQLIEHLKKADMAIEATRLLDDTGWLPEPLRLASVETATDASTVEAESLPDFLAGEGEEATAADPDEPETNAIAAE
jgi:ParB family transcriptional regulator, chromosome partitioning protein